MRALWTFIVLVCTAQLLALVEFNQTGAFSITNGEFSFAEVKSVGGTDRIIVYSQDMLNVFVSIHDIEGNPIESMAIAMPDSTDNRTMSYFEYDNNRYIVLNRVEVGEREYETRNWTSRTTLISEIYNLETTECIDTHIVQEFTSSFISDDWQSILMGYSAVPNQCITQSGISDECTLCAPFSTSSVSQDHEEFNYDDYWTFPKTCIIAFGDSISYQNVEDIGWDVISGDNSGFPVIFAARFAARSDHYDGEQVFTSVSNGIYTNDYFFTHHTHLHEFYSDAYTCDRYVLLSDNYTESPATITILSVDFSSADRTYTCTFYEVDLSGNIVWESTESTMSDDMLLNGMCASSCIAYGSDIPMTMYFAPASSHWEIRNRENGDVIDCGNAPFTPSNIERLESGTLVFIGCNGSDIEIWHGSYTVAINNPTNSAPYEIVVENYPNPFNPTTTIALSLPTPGDVVINIYNTRGQLVKSLLNERLSAGDHEVTWDGMNEMGTPVSSGIYLYRISNGKEIISHKMVMLK